MTAATLWQCQHFLIAALKKAGPADKHLLKTMVKIPLPEAGPPMVLRG
jgi:hypothetical protein